MLNMYIFNSIFETPMLTEKENHKPKVIYGVSDKIKGQVLDAIIELGVAAPKDVRGIVDCNMAYIYRCIDRLKKDNEIKVHSTKRVAKATVTKYRAVKEIINDRTPLANRG